MATAEKGVGGPGWAGHARFPWIGASLLIMSGLVGFELGGRWWQRLPS